MSEKRPHQQSDDDEGSIFVLGAMLEFEALDSAIDLLAEDEIHQADEARKESGSQECEPY
jgi:hypothetical protein